MVHLRIFSILLLWLLVQPFNSVQSQDWQRIFLPIDSTIPLTGLTFLSADTGFVFGEFGTFLATTNGGQSWSQPNFISCTECISRIDHLFFFNKQAGHVIVFKEGLHDSTFDFKTTNSGETWIKQPYYNFGLAPNSDLKLSQVKRLSDSLVFASAFAYMNQSYREYFLRSNNAGTSWDTLISSSVASGGFKPHFDVRTTVYNYMEDGYYGSFYHSADNGLSWSKPILQSDILLSLTEDKWLAFNIFGTVWRSEDKGENWKEMLDPFPNSTPIALTVGFYDSLIGYLVFDRSQANDSTKSLLKTTDGGLSWKQHSLIDETIKTAKLSIPTSKVGYALLNNKLYKTINGGGLPLNNVCSGIEDRSIQIYPNPASSRVFVYNKDSKGTIDVLDHLGRKVYRSPLTPGKTIVDLTSLRNGIYYCSINGQIQKLLIFR